MDMKRETLTVIFIKQIHPQERINKCLLLLFKLGLGKSQISFKNTSKGKILFVILKDFILK
jgi:hypothetical protein